jgi:hypothetical protein
MEIRKEIVYGKKKMIIISSASGVDKVRDAVKYIMGPGFEHENDNKEDIDGEQSYKTNR